MKTTLSDPITSAVRRTLLVSRVVLEFLYDDALVVLHRCFRHQLLLPRPYLVLTKPLRLVPQRFGERCWSAAWCSSSCTMTRS